MPIQFHGKRRAEIQNRLLNEWLPKGPPVAILQGFPGCGKSQLALSVLTQASRSIDLQEPQSNSPDDFLLDLAIILEAKGLPDMAKEIDNGKNANLGKAFLDLLRREPILIVVDEFQRFLPKDKSLPPPEWRWVIESLGTSRNPQGRLLLVTNRVIKLERWCENCHFEEVRGLEDDEATTLFTELLESSDVASKVPPERRREIVHRLGGNPRALRTLVFGLRTETLDELLSGSPDLSKPGDVVLNAQLLEDFERELIERALTRLDDDLLKFMRWLFVYRRPFHKEALAQFTGGESTCQYFATTTF
jgi:hypothetical protein